MYGSRKSTPASRKKQEVRRTPPSVGVPQMVPIHAGRRATTSTKTSQSKRMFKPELDRALGSSLPDSPPPSPEPYEYDDDDDDGNVDASHPLVNDASLARANALAAASVKIEPPATSSLGPVYSSSSASAAAAASAASVLSAPVRVKVKPSRPPPLPPHTALPALPPPPPLPVVAKRGRGRPSSGSGTALSPFYHVRPPRMGPNHGVIGRPIGSRNKPKFVTRLPQAPLGGAGVPQHSLYYSGPHDEVYYKV